MENINMTEFEIKLNHDLGLLSELEKFLSLKENVVKPKIIPTIVNTKQESKMIAEAKEETKALSLSLLKEAEKSWDLCAKKYQGDRLLEAVIRNLLVKGFEESEIYDALIIVEQKKSKLIEKKRHWY